MQLQLVVTGMHLTQEYGLTCREIESDGFCIDKKIDILLSSGTEVGVAKSMGLATLGFADAFQELSPDILVLLGDRFEALAAAQVAMVLRIPIAHIHGGERTEGLIDEAIRHSITKISHLHFVAAGEYRRRVIQLGEQPDRVFVVGAPGLDNIRTMQLLGRAELEGSLGCSLSDQLIVVTYHPVTLEDRPAEEGIAKLLQALQAFPEATIVLTYPNADPRSRAIYGALEQFSKTRDKTLLVPSLGYVRYLSAVHHADVVVGNSSSGLIEAPFLRTPTVNIGTRQQGRLAGNSVFNCPEDALLIEQSIRQAISKKGEMQHEEVSSLYGDGYAAEKILSLLREADVKKMLVKNFYDLGDS
jgi:UDP-hydrolysing UDP-N-acetyl-D-glucosamine 2-epimerase